MSVPVIDLFAGPGGLGEGFSALLNGKEQVFKIALSIEKDEHAHRTLTLRSFFRQFAKGHVPGDYYSFLKGEISLPELYGRWPREARHGANEAWCATLGEGPGATDNKEVDARIREELKGAKNWLLIGGPPCQAYSVMGRSRRQERILDERKDERVVLYKQYLRILAVHNPAVFVMENVKGLLSAETRESPVFTRILNDLSDPVSAFRQEYKTNEEQLSCPGYKLYSLAVGPKSTDENGAPQFDQKDFVIQAEYYGVPQTRHRIIILGVRKDLDVQPSVLKRAEKVPVSQVLGDLPRLRAGLSKSKGNAEDWKTSVYSILEKGLLMGTKPEVKKEILTQLTLLKPSRQGTGGPFVLSTSSKLPWRSSWFLDPRIGGVCNHSARTHMPGDLRRYFFAACFARVNHQSPKLTDFPAALLPDHKNISEGLKDKKFADRFRVQLWDQPAKTITSHISKDGHYYIHPDPSQCRSLSVREAARIQTFPDNYYFCGGRTHQFHQVGNAVPPLLAYQIAGVVAALFTGLKIYNDKKEKVKGELRRVSRYSGISLK